jgi:internalin A
LFLIRKTLNDIHKDFNKLEVREMIPCNCKLCSNSDTPHFYDFNLLKRYESKEILDIRCEISLEEVVI